MSEGAVNIPKDQVFVGSLEEATWHRRIMIRLCRHLNGRPFTMSDVFDDSVVSIIGGSSRTRLHTIIERWANTGTDLVAGKVAGAPRDYSWKDPFRSQALAADPGPESVRRAVHQEFLDSWDYVPPSAGASNRLTVVAPAPIPLTQLPAPSVSAAPVPAVRPLEEDGGEEGPAVYLVPGDDGDAEPRVGYVARGVENEEEDQVDDDADPPTEAMFREAAKDVAEWRNILQGLGGTDPKYSPHLEKAEAELTRVAKALGITRADVDQAVQAFVSKPPPPKVRRKRTKKSVSSADETPPPAPAPKEDPSFGLIDHTRALFDQMDQESRVIFLTSVDPELLIQALDLLSEES